MAKRCLETLIMGGITYPLSSIDDYSFLRTDNYGETQVPPERNTFIDVPSTFHLSSEPTFKIESDLTKKTYQIGNGGVLDYPRESGTDSYYGLYTGWLFYNRSTVLCGDRFYPNYNFTKSTYLVIVVDDDTEDAWIVHISMNYNGKIRYFHLHPKNGNENILYTIFRTSINNGGGATHIAKRAGLLSSIGASNLSDVLIVSGGGGGGLIIGEDVYAGKDAGGIAGSGNNSANQTTGYAFGQGESAEGVSGGGGGLYGGYKGGTS